MDVRLTPAAAQQILIGPDGRLTRDGIIFLQQLLAVAQQAAAAQDTSAGALQAANNLSDVTSVVTARANLGLGSAATHAATDFDPAGAAAAAQAASLQKGANLADVANAAAARANLGLGSAATANTGNLSEATSDVLLIGGGIGAVLGPGTTIQVQQASAAQDGYLSKGDWATFNAKQPALSVVNDTNVTGAVSGGSFTLGWSGTLALARGGTGAATPAAALANLGGASLTAANTFSGAQTFSGTNPLTILTGTASDTMPALSVALVAGEIHSDGSATSDYGFLRLSAGGGTDLNTKAAIDLNGYGASDNSQIRFYTAGLERGRITTSGNLLLGTTSDAGSAYKLQVQGGLSVSGSGLFSGQVNFAGTTLAGSGNAGSTGTLQWQANPGSPVSGRLLFGTDGTGWQLRIGKNQGGAITDYVQVQDNGAWTFLSGCAVTFSGGATLNSGLNLNGQTVSGSGTFSGTVTFSNPVKMSQNATGSGAAALGANCPAVTLGAPYTWLKLTAADGSTVYVPAWK